MNTVIYLRQSVDRTGDELAVQRQQTDARRLARQRGWTVAAEYTDNDISAAGKRTRPGFEAVLAALDSGAAQAVIAWDMSRLTRNARDRLRLLEVGRRREVVVSFVRGSDLDLGTPAGRLTADILGSVAQHEIDQKADRQRAAAAQAAAQGRRIGGRRPFGYAQDGLAINDDEAGAVRDGYTALLSGASLGSIARDWNGRGLPTPQARRDGTPSPWTAQTVRPVLLNPRYAGLRAHVTEKALEAAGGNPRAARLRSVVGTAAWPALVPEETWRAAVDLLTDDDRMNPPRGGRALLTGLALCGVCDATVHAGAAPARGGRQERRTYRCSASYGHVGRAALPVEAYIRDVIVARLSRSDARDLLVDHNRPDVDALRTELSTLRTRRKSILALVADGTFTENEARAQVTVLTRRTAEVEAALSDAGRVNVLGPLVDAADPAAAWDALDIERQRAVIDALMTVRLLPPGRGTRTFRPESVVITWR
ncbi:recombinase family protein [Micromonospora aurantiaca (nom. illeg.)]|uniref:recombinase family protein n=1 Tax=Micromonospora aurantiaca (nom. illeg.) TaxID=47850 RepID=UPI0036A2FCE4